MSLSDRRRAARRRSQSASASATLPGFEDEGEDFTHDDAISKVAVLFPLPLPEPFDYRAPTEWGLKPGDHVIAPLGPRSVHGVVWSVVHNNASAANLKSIESSFDAAPLPDVSRSFIDWSARYVVTPPGNMLRMVLRSSEALLPSPTFSVFEPSGAACDVLTPARARVLEAAAESPGTGAELARRANVSSSVVKGLIDMGVLARRQVAEDAPFPPPDLTRVGKPLSDAQAAAAEMLREAVRSDAYAAVLLDGVTGSGKTEVYLEAVAETLARDPSAQVLVLLPEIALTQAVLARFEERFGTVPVEWHSAIGAKARRRAWREVNEGRARLVVGARSALFLPYRNLRLIVVDEEHDGSYKQEEGVAYHARDLAVVRAKLGEAVIVLASATPSLETLVNAQGGRYRHVKLSARHGVAVLPDVELIDLKLDPPEKGRWISPKLIAAAAEALAKGEQALFYMNRRGYAPLTLCRACGHRMQSPDTQSWLVEHKYTGRLVCHLTGFSMPKPKTCPNCLAPDSFVAIGPGVERVEEEARDLFPRARIEVFSSDTAQGGDQVRAIVDRMANGEIDILIGTQIVAKGHNFPLLTVVGVLDADLGLKGGDLRAGERTYQLLSQVAGRAGRADRPGRAFLQTYAPEHEAMIALSRHDRDGFLAAEAAAREAMGMPPYGRLAAVILSGPDEATANRAAIEMGEKAPSADGVEVWGPAPAPLTVIRGLHRRRFLVRSDRNVDLSAFMAAWRERLKLPASIRVQIDIEPYSFL